MLLLEAKNIKKEIGDRLLFKINNFKLYEGECVGIVGKNGSGKTTFMKMLLGKDNDFEGSVDITGKIAYIPQIDMDQASHLSGGEWVKKKIEEAFSQNAGILFADEPTCNLDIDGIEYLEKSILAFKGAVLLITHDKALLEKVCNKILDFDGDKPKLYVGNYDNYLLEKQLEQESHLDAYEKYVAEKKRLETSIQEINRRGSAIKKAPKRMGNSEARLHRREATEKAAKVQGAKKTIQSRLERLEKVEKPFEAKEIKIEVPQYLKLYSKVLVEGRKVNKAFDNKVIFKDASFVIENGTKTAIIGKNGCGKTTLLRMIMDGHESIKTAPKLKLGYFKQNLSNLSDDKTILENVMDSTTRKEQEVRNFLAHFLFRGDDVYKKVEVLSGGERIKASFAKIMLSDINVLVLDEPTNYLDMETKKALEDALSVYEGAVILVSHDREFIMQVANRLLYIEGHKIHSYSGDIREYFNKSIVTHTKSTTDNSESRMLLENRLNYIIGRISNPQKNDKLEELNAEYEEIIEQLKRLK